MFNTASNYCWKVVGVAVALAGLVAWSGTSQGQTITGQASAVTAFVLGNVASLADSGTLIDPSDPLGTGQGTGSIPGLVSGEALHAVTMGWSDQVASEASLGNLVMSVAGIGISADAITSRALAVSGAVPTGRSNIEGLTIGGVSVSPTGAPNQTVSVLGLSVILNEQIQSANGIVVNALHVRTLDGLTDVVVGFAKAGI
jgi:hypothetical protein